jgi:hypothetical protein
MEEEEGVATHLSGSGNNDEDEAQGGPDGGRPDELDVEDAKTLSDDAWDGVPVDGGFPALPINSLLSMSTW